MTQESRKFGTKVEFESFDEGGKFEPLKLPDLSPYREANRDTLLQDFERNEQLGLANLKLEQDKHKEIDAWNAQVWEYMAQAGIDRLKPLSKALNKYASAYAKNKDIRDAENALIEFQTAYQNGDIPALEEVLNYDKVEEEAQRVDGVIQGEAGRAHQEKTLDSDNIWRLKSLSPWRDGPHKQKLLLQYYATKIGPYLESTANTPVYIEALGQSFSAAEPEKWPKGYAVAIQAAIDKQNIANLVGMFKGFNKVAVAKYITPQIIAYQEKQVMNFADQQSNAMEEAVYTEIKNSLTPLYDGEPRLLYDAVQEQFEYASKWMPPGQAKLAIFNQLLSDAKAGLLSEDAARELLDTVMDPNSKKKQTYRQFLGERFLLEYDLEGAARAHAFDKENNRQQGHKAADKQLENDLKDAAKEYADKNNGAAIPKEILWDMVRKWQGEHRRDGWPMLNKILHAENYDDEYVKENLEHLRVISGGKLTEDMIKDASPAVQQHFRDQGQVVASALAPNAANVKAGKKVIEGYVNDYIKSTSPWAPGSLKRQTVESAQLDYVTLYQKNLEGGMPHHQADEDARAKVEQLIQKGNYKTAERQFGSSVAKFGSMREEFKQNEMDPSVPIRSIQADVEQMIKTYERTGRLQIPHSLHQFARIAQITPQEAAVLQSRGKIKLPSVEVKINQKLGKNNLLTKNGTPSRTVRTSVENEDIYIDLQKPEYQTGEYDAKDKNGRVTNIDIEKQTIAEVMNLLERGEITTASGYEFTYQQILNAWADSNLNPDSLMTPDIQKILFDHLQIPGKYPHVEPTEELSYWNSNFLWRPA
tara:strand:- start:420 stop:2864 length:2445 start_codon:yes stop_codon:yes gene_type:complete